MNLEPNIQEIKSKITQDMQIRSNQQDEIVLSRKEQARFSHQLMTYVKEFNNNNDLFFLTFTKKTININNKLAIGITFYINLLMSYRTVDSITVFPKGLFASTI